MDGFIDSYNEQLDVEAQALLAQIDIGKQALSFFESPLGQYIKGSAIQDIIEHRFKLEEMDLNSQFKEAQAAQLAIKSCYLALHWLENAIIIGQQAEEQLDQLSRTD